MGNINRGEVDLVAGDEIHRLRLTFNSLCALEDVAQKSATEFFADLLGTATAGGIDFRMLRTAMWAALLHHNPSMTLPEAGAVIDAVGLPESVKAVQAAIVAFFPKAETPQDPAGADTENP